LNVQPSDRLGHGLGKLTIDSRKEKMVCCEARPSPPGQLEGVSAVIVDDGWPCLEREPLRDLGIYEMLNGVLG